MSIELLVIIVLLALLSAQMRAIRQLAAAVVSRETAHETERVTRTQAFLKTTTGRELLRDRLEQRAQGRI